MFPTPGTYYIHNTDSGRVFSYYYNNEFPDKIGTWKNDQVDSQKWHVNRYPGSSLYAIQSIRFKNYIGVDADGRNAYGVGGDDAATLELEQVSQNSYLIKITGTKRYLGEPPESTPSGHRLVCLTEKIPSHSYVWRFERIGEDAGSALKTIVNDTTPAPPVSQPNDLLSQNSGSLYPDDAHFYTDLLFNMPRTPFTRTQRIATLDWARRLGATKVPTMESFDECERRLEAALGSNSNTNPSG